MSTKPLSVVGSLMMTIGLLLLAAGIVLVGGPEQSGLTLAASAAEDELGLSLDDLMPDWGRRPVGPVIESRAVGAEEAGNTENQISSTTETTVAVAPDEPPPVGIRIPAIGVEASMIPLGLRADRTIEVPDDFSQTGWWVDGPEPGERGPAVVLGHVDSRSGPAVFFDLRNLEPGDRVVIDRTDGTSVTYRVDRLEQHAKDEFPTEAVYGPTPDAELRLVTCGGVFDRSIRHYVDNLVVFASLV